jgi:saccharopine dehydrogenase-like NADP-dependent oxidoreductase
MDFLGLFDNKAIIGKFDNAFDITADAMINKMTLKDNERDMVALQHVFVAIYPDGKKEVIKSRLLDFGSPATDTSIARTVALPASIAAEMILQNKISAKGVHIPVTPEIYNPILDALETIGIKMEEEYGLPLSEAIN